MDFADFLKVIQDEAAVITGAPFLSLGLIALGFILAVIVVRQLYESRLATKDATIEHLRAALDHQRQQPLVASASDGLQPTVEMLEASRKEMEAHRKQLVHSWREMVRTVHSQLQHSKLTGISVTPTEVLEILPEFLTYRQHMGEEAKDAVYRGVIVDPPPGSTMHGTLHRILKDIERLEREWRLT